MTGRMIVAGLALLMGPCAAEAQPIGDWNVGGGQGYRQYIVTNASGDEFAFGCDEGASMRGEPKKTYLLVTIGGEPPPPNSSYTVSADGHDVDFYSDETGSTDTLCKVCSANFIELWTRVRAAGTVTVTLSDKREAAFRVNGAAKALPRRHCMTGYESQ